MSERVASALRLRAARSTTPLSERALTVYSVVLAALIYGTPAVLASREGWGAGSGSPVALTAAGLAICAALFVAGRSRGPLSFTMGDVDLLLAGPARRTAAYAARPFVVMALFATVGGFVGAIVLTTVAPPAPGALPALVAGALSGGILGIGALAAWLLGEADARYGALALPGAALLAWSLADPTLAPWAMTSFPPLWGAVIASAPWDPGIRIALAAVVLVASAATVVLAWRAIVARSRGETLRIHAARWDRARTAATVLDLRTAAGALGDRAPRFFRGATLSAFFGAGHRRSLIRAVFARDLLGGVRRWPRLVGALALVAGGLGILGGAWGSTWALAGVALTTIGVDRAADGLRTHAENLGRSNHLDPPTARAAWAHLALPGLIAALGAVVGSAVSALVGSFDPLVVASTFLVALAALALVPVSAYRFRPPEALMGPINTPVGDVGAAIAIAWWVRTHLVLIAFCWLAMAIPTPGSLVALGAAVALALVWALRAFRAEHRAVTA